MCPQRDAVCETVHRFTTTYGYVAGVDGVAGGSVGYTQEKYQIMQSRRTIDTPSTTDTPPFPLVHTSIMVNKLCVQRSKCKKPGCYEKSNGVTVSNTR